MARVNPSVCGRDEGENCWRLLPQRRRRPSRGEHGDEGGDGDGGGGGGDDQDLFRDDGVRVPRPRPTETHRHRRRRPARRACVILRPVFHFTSRTVLLITIIRL